MRPTSPDPPAPLPSSGRDGQAKQLPKTDWRMRYEMGAVELVGWMIVGGFLGVFVCALVMIATGPAPDPGTGLDALALSIMIGAAVPIVVYCRGKQR